ncbi:MAG TPA: toast rack family protein [Candidatus Angelobacter sp.]|nr:toast rack family protein [Candidatus Angelobacter sp.]
MSEYRRGSMVGAILLIGLGVLFLYGNLRPGLDPWWLLARYWPLLLVFLGLGKLWDYYRRRSDPDAAKKRWLGGGEIAIIILVVLFGIALSLGRGRATWSSGHHIHDVQTVDLPGAQSAKVHIEMPAGHLDLSGGASQALEGTFDYYESEGKPTVSHEVVGNQGEVSITQEGPHTHFLRRGGNNWTVHLNKDLPTDLKINVGAGQGEFQLGGLSLTGLEINMGAGQVTVDLRGDWKKDLEATIEGGVGQATIRLPDNVGVRVHATSGIGSISASGLEHRDDYYVNSAYGKSPVTLRLNIDKGIGTIDLVLEHSSGRSSDE